MIIIRHNALQKDFYGWVRKYPLINELVDKLSSEGDLLLFGGSVRNYFENQFKTLPRDFDIVVNTTNEIDSYFKDYNFTKNRYGGFKVSICGIEFDIWTLENTWAFKEKKVSIAEKNLTETVFLNLDSIVYNLSKGLLYSKLYEKALQTKTLDVVLHENPYVELNLLRALVFKKKYGFNLSCSLINYFRDCDSYHKDFFSILHDIQYSHYGKEILSKNEIYKEVSKIVS
ncbi:hypothetical protein ND894_19175 [Priestia megaterium]|uniref:hypothetical protein n=1 Tax=Priestia megaterium TaxID=1404 RepID=UPI0020767C16|nr:hypothetical protein [Priestia megaterium]USD14094.1 hypothetical protein ND894_19175 [Priestia megaterium]